MLKEFVYRSSRTRLIAAGLTFLIGISCPLSAQLAIENHQADTGYAELKAGNQTQAEIEFRKALEADPTDLSAQLGLAMIQTERQEHAAAFAAYDSIVQSYPQNIFAWNQRGLAAFNLEDFDEALSSFERATANKPVNGFFYESLAWTLMCRGEFPQAAESAKTATLMYHREGQTAIYPLLIAYFSYLEAGDANNATRSLRYAIKNHNPNQWPAPVLAYLNGKIDEAEMVSFVTNTAEETEAHTYIGLKLRSEEAHETASKHLNWVSRHGDPRVFEYTLARAINLQSSVAVWQP